MEPDIRLLGGAKGFFQCLQGTPNTPRQFIIVVPPKLGHPNEVWRKCNRRLFAQLRENTLSDCQASCTVVPFVGVDIGDESEKRCEQRLAGCRRRRRWRLRLSTSEIYRDDVRCCIGISRDLRTWVAKVAKNSDGQ